MRRSLIVLVLVMLAAVPAHAAPPSNDDAKNATVISEFPATLEVDTTEATTGPFEEQCFGVGAVLVSVRPPARAVWYRVDLPDDAEYLRVTHAGPASVVMWDRIGTAPTGEPLLDRYTCAYENDTYPFWVAGRDEFYMSVAAPLDRSVPSLSMSLELVTSTSVPVPNDVPYRATRIDALPYTTSQNTFAADWDSDPQGCSHGAYVWYRYTPPVDEHLEISVTADVDTATISAYAVGEHEVETLGCDSNYDVPAVVISPVSAGVPVLIGIGGEANLQLSVRTVPGPDPDEGPDQRASAVPLSFGPALPFSTAGATLEPGEPLSCGEGGSVWFSLPRRLRAARIVVDGAVSYAAVAAEEILACANGATLDVPAEATHIQIRSANGTGGSIALRFDPSVGVQVTDESPFEAGCGDPADGPYVDSEVEVSQAVNRADPNHVLVAWQQDRHSDRGGARGIGAAVTFDGGTTWTNSVIPGLSLCSGGLFLRATDPWVAFDADGTAYVMSLTYNPGPANAVNLSNSVVINRSTDGGRTWSDPITVAASPGVYFHDKETLTADPNTPGLLYAVWSTTAGHVFTRSEDGGRTWLPTIPMRYGGTGNQIAVLDDGTLVLVAESGSVISVTSKDRGTTWSDRRTVGPGGFMEGPPGIRGGAYIPSVSTDGQSVFVSWSDTGATYFARSDDGGATWKYEIVAGEPEWFDGERNRFTTAVASTDDGTLAVMTYMLDDNFDAYVALASSTDGGETWSEDRITDTFDMDRAPHSAGRGYFLGDYFGLAGSGNDVIAALTAVPPGTTNGVANVYSLKIAL